MKVTVIVLAIFSIIALASQGASRRLSQKVDLTELHLNMSIEQVYEKFGTPDSKDRNQLVYILKDASQLYLSLRDEVVSSAVLKFHRPLKLEEPEIRKLTLVQMSHSEENPSWFFAGKPEEGLIYKITSKGEIETLTWVKPFSYGSNEARNLQALLLDFRKYNLSRM